MIVPCFDLTFDVPDVVINKFIKDFDGLAGNGHRYGILNLRAEIWKVLDVVENNMTLLGDSDFVPNFLKALAMKQALTYHGVWFDA